MASRYLPTPEHASASMAMAASTLELSQPEKGRALMELALETPGANPTSLAGAAALCGAASFLELALDRGADPLGIACMPPLRRALPPGDEEASLMRLAVLGGNPLCCSALASRGVDVLSEVNPERLSALSASHCDGSAFPWDCALAALAGSAPNSAKATLLAAELLAPAMASFSPALEKGSKQPEQAILTLRRLRELGALLATRADRDDPLSPSLATLLFQGGALKMFWRGEPTDIFHALHLLCDFCKAVDPGSSPERLTALVERHPLGALGHSALPSKPVQALRELATREALDCQGTNPAALAILLLGRKSESSESSASRDATRDARPLWWMADSAADWTAPDKLQMERCKELIAQCLVESAELSQAKGQANKLNPGAWLSLAEDPRQASTKGFPGRHPMECAKIAAMSHPDLEAAYRGCVQSASLAANQDLGSEELRAVSESACLGALSSKPEERHGAGPLRV